MKSYALQSRKTHRRLLHKGKQLKKEAKIRRATLQTVLQLKKGSAMERNEKKSLQTFVQSKKERETLFLAIGR